MIAVASGIVELVVTLALVAAGMAAGPRLEILWRATRTWVRHRYGT
jgi:hypothetical protein